MTTTPEPDPRGPKPAEQRCFGQEGRGPPRPPLAQMGSRPRRKGNHRARAVLVAALMREELDDPKRSSGDFLQPLLWIPAKDR